MRTLILSALFLLCQIGFSQSISSNSPICETNSDIIKLNSSGGRSYKWSGPNGFSSEEQNPIISNPTKENSGTYTVVIDDKFTLNTAVEVGSEVTGNNQISSFIDGKTIKLFSNFYSNYHYSTTSYEWEGPDGFESSVNSPVISNFTKENLGEYSLTITDNYGCETLLKKQVTVPNPECPYRVTGFVSTLKDRVDFTKPLYGSYSICKGTSVTIGIDTTTLVLDQDAEVQWYKNNSLTEIKSLEFENSSEGGFKFVIKTGGCEYTSEELKLTMVSATQPYLILPDYRGQAVICETGDAVDLRIRSNIEVLSDVEEYIWRRNGEEVAVGKDLFRLTVTDMGSYSVEVKEDNCTNETDPVQVGISNKPDHIFAFYGFDDKKTVESCSVLDNTFTLNALGLSKYSSHTILDENGIRFSDGDRVKSGSYFLKLTQGDCVVYDTLRIVESNNFDIPVFSYNYAEKNCRNTFYFHSRLSLNNNYYFVTKDDKRLRNANYYYTTESGEYRLNYKDPDNSCFGKTKVLPFSTLENSNTIDILGPNVVEICKGEYYQMRLSNPNVFQTYKWKRDGVLIKDSQIPSSSVNKPGKYWVESIDENGCFLFSDTITISLKEIPSIALIETCSPTGLGSNLKVDISEPKANVNYRWYFDGEKLNRDGDLSINIKKAGKYSLLAKVEECYIPVDAIDIGKSVKNSFSFCRNDTITIKPLSDLKTKHEWISPLGAVIGNKDSLVIFNATSTNNGIYTLRSESLAGCRHERDFSVEVRDRITFDVTPILEVDFGELIVPETTEGIFSDSTEVPTSYSFQMVEPGYGRYYSKRLNETEDVISVPAESSTLGLYKIIGSGAYGCSTEKTFEVKLRDKSVLRLAELNPEDLCPNSEIIIPIVNAWDLPAGVNFIVRMYSGDGKDSLSLVVNNDTARISYMPPTFFKYFRSSQGIFFKLSVSDGSVKPYRSRWYSFTSSYYQFLEAIEQPLCDSVRFEVLSSYSYGTVNYQWYKDDELIVGAISSSFSAFERGTYDLIGVGGSNKTCPFGNIRTFNSAELLGTLSKPIISYNQGDYCDSGNSKLEVRNHSEGMKYSWELGNSIITNTDGSVLQVGENGEYKVSVELGNCTSVSESFNFKQTQVISVPLLVANKNASGESSGYFDYSKPLQLCNGTSFNLRLGNEEPKDTYSNIKWYLGGKLIGGNNVVQTFDKEGVYRATGTRGYCSVVSTPVEVSYEDTIRTQLQLLGREEVKFGLSGQVLMYTGNQTYNDLFESSFGGKWFRDDYPYFDRNEIGLLSGYRYLSRTIYPEASGAYSAVGHVLTHDGKTCVISSDTIRLYDLILGEGESVSVDTVNINLCGSERSSLGFDNSRALSSTWYRNGIKIAENVDSFKVSEAASYEVVYDVKDKGKYKKVFNVEIAENPEIRFSSQKLPEGIFLECIPDDFYLTLAESFSRLNEYQWYKDDVPLGVQNAVLKPSENGVYKLKGLQNGCEGFSNSLTVNFKNSSDLNLGESNQYLCNGESVELKNLNDDDESYLWLKEGQILSFLGTNTFKVEAEGNYTALLEANSCLIASNEVYIENLNIVDILYYNRIDSVFCPGTSVMLTAEEQEGLNYRFVQNETTVYSGSNNSYEAKETGFYKVFYEKGNCSIGSNELSIRKDFETDILFESATFCEGGSIDLSFETTEDLSYKWYKDNVPLSSGSSLLTVDEAGAYFAQLSSSNCSSFSDTIQVKNHKESIAKITGTSTIAYGDSTEISIEILGDASPWQVTLSDGSALSIENSPYQHYVSPIQTTEYTITALTDECGVGTFEGTATVNLIILGTEINGIENLNIYPNPSDSYIFVDYSSEENPIPTLTSMDGKNVSFSYDFSNGKMRIDLSGVAGGIYLLSLELEGVRKVKKVIKR